MIASAYCPGKNGCGPHADPVGQGANYHDDRECETDRGKRFPSQSRDKKGIYQIEDDDRKSSQDHGGGQPKKMQENVSFSQGGLIFH